jgi:hypothetical protein
VLVEAVRELNVKLENIDAAATKLLASESFLAGLRNWLASATNGITKISTEQLCVRDANGETCLSRDQINQIQSSLNSNTGSPNGGLIVVPTIPINDTPASDTSTSPSDGVSDTTSDTTSDVTTDDSVPDPVITPPDIIEIPEITTTNL